MRSIELARLKNAACDDQTFFIYLQQRVGLFWRRRLWRMDLSLKSFLSYCQSDKEWQPGRSERQLLAGDFFFSTRTQRHVIKCFEFSFTICVCVCVCVVYKAISIRRHCSEWGWCLPKPWRVGRVSMRHNFLLHYYTLPQTKCLNRPLN